MEEVKWCVNIKSGNERSSPGYVGTLIAIPFGVSVAASVDDVGTFLRHTHARLSRTQPEQLRCFSPHWNVSELSGPKDEQWYVRAKTHLYVTLSALQAPVPRLLVRCSSWHRLRLVLREIVERVLGIRTKLWVISL